MEKELKIDTYKRVTIGAGDELYTKTTIIDTNNKKISSINKFIEKFNLTAKQNERFEQLLFNLIMYVAEETMQETKYRRDAYHARIRANETTQSISSSRMYWS